MELRDQAAFRRRELAGLPHAIILFLFPVLLWAQHPTGSIRGTVVDVSGAIICEAHVKVHNPATGMVLELPVSRAGTFAAAGLVPGEYVVIASAAGMTPANMGVRVQVGRESRADLTLAVGAVTESLQVTADALSVSSSSSTLDGVISGPALRELPLNGRQFLELAALEPGAQVHDGGAVTGLKDRYAGVSLNGRSGLTTRVTVDGLDISDEMLGSIVQNVSLDAVEEFQITRSMADASAGISGSGTVNIATRGGTNNLHGSAFVYWRDETLAARIGPRKFPFDRTQAGFTIGGPLLRNRLFGFAGYERNNQDDAQISEVPGFPQFSGMWAMPFDERAAIARLDALPSRHVRAFARFTHNANRGLAGDLSTTGLSPQAQQNNANQVAVGLDSTAGRTTHSLRFGHLNYAFHNRDGIPEVRGLAAVTQVAGPGLAVGIPALRASFGTNINAPARRLQESNELRYDGTAVISGHLLHWGLLTNDIAAQWYSAVFNTPRLNVQFNLANASICGRDLLCYPVIAGTIGNGLGYLSEKPGFGEPYGTFTNRRYAWYLADQWQLGSRITLSAGLRHSIEPGQDNSDLVKPAVLEQFMPGLSRPNRVEHNNFAPQLGISWSPAASFVIRAGAGLYYDTKLMRDRRWERTNLLPSGVAAVNPQFPARKLIDPMTAATIFDATGADKTALITPGQNWITGCKDPRFPSGQCPLGTPGLIAAVQAASQAFIAAHARALENYPAGPSVCESTRQCVGIAPDYHSPYTVQFNIGVQKELRRNLVLSLDYLQHRGVHYLVAPDANRLGAADTLDPARALAAMNALHASLGCPAGPAGVNCAIGKKAKITSYATRGLGSAGNADAAAPNTSAFPGLNRAFNNVQLHSMTGRSRYRALTIQLRGALPDFLVRDTTISAAYALSRYEGTAGDNDLWFSGDYYPNDRSTRFFGPTTLDRTHIISVSSTFTVPGGFRLNSIWRFASALPQSVFVPSQGAGTAEIFKTDLNGDGTPADPLPGTNRGSYGRDIGCGASALNPLIDRYNQERAGRPTPAGSALITAGLFTEAQLVALDAVAPTLQRAPDAQVCLDSLITSDLRLSRPIKVASERVRIEPALEVFNLFNVANFDLPIDRLSGALNGTVGSINGTTAANRANRAALRGSFAGGSPRSWQLSLRVTF